MGLRTKLLFPLLLASILFSGMMHFIWRPDFLASESNNLINREQNVLKLIQTDIARNLLANDLAALHASLNEHMEINKGFWKQITLHNVDGIRLFPLIKPEPIENHSFTSIHHPILWKDKTLGVIQLIIDEQSLLDEVSKRIYRLEFIAVGLFTVLLIIGAVMQNKLVRQPIVSLKNAAGRLAKGDFNVNLSKDSSDEIGDLTLAFKKMREDLFSQQNKLKHTTSAALESEAKKRSILNNMGAGVITLNNKQRIIDFNPAAEKIFGYIQSEIFKQKLTRLIIDDNKYTSNTNIIDKLVNLQSEANDNHIELHGIHKSGNVFPMDLVISDININNKQLYICIVRDISEQKLNEQRLIDAKNAAERANEAKSQFLSSMSHELRTPLNAILGFSQLIQYDENLTDIQQENISQIHIAGEHLLELVNNVLDLAKIEAGKLDLSIEQVNLSQVLTECKNILKFPMSQKGISLSYDNKLINTVSIDADAFRLKQILLNLLSNAIKYNKPQGSISIDCIYTKDSHWLIKVSDTGLGIKENKLEHLFTPFDRLGSETSTIEGTGIGLTITKTLVELMNGKIGVESSYGEGSCFWFELNGSIRKELTTSSPEMHETEISDQSQLDTRFSLLYADDNEVNRLIVQQALKRFQNINYITAENGLIGLEKANQYKPDLIFLDIHMPEMGGNELCRILKSQTPDTPIIAISADAGPKAIENSLKIGFDDYITKPFNMNVLVKTINDYLPKKGS